MAGATASDSERVTAIIDGLDDWRGEVLRTVRQLTHEADPEVVEEIKWVKPSNPAGVPTWTHDGILFTGEVYKDKVKLTFMDGASLDDPEGLFNSSLDGKTRRAIDLRTDDQLDPDAFRALVGTAVAHRSG